MGSPEDFAGMLDAVARHGIKPVIDAVFPLAGGNDAFERMKTCGQFGKLVLRIAD